MAYLTEKIRWAAVRDRDPAADSAFVYSVSTTHIHCRPTCKGRLARRSNVGFYDTSAEAEAAGFRPCKRCKPELKRFISDADVSIERIRRVLEELPDEAPLPKLETLAAGTGLTKFHFHRCFKKATGMTPRVYAMERRRSRQAALGRQIFETVASSSSITPALASDTWSSSTVPNSNDLSMTNSNFDEWLDFDVNDLLLGEPYMYWPEDHHALSTEPSCGSCGPPSLPVEIHYTIAQTATGILIVAFQNQKICKLELVVSEDEAVRSLEKAFPSPVYLRIDVLLLDDCSRLLVERQAAAIVSALKNPTALLGAIAIAPPTPPRVKDTGQKFLQ